MSRLDFLDLFQSQFLLWKVMALLSSYEAVEEDLLVSHVVGISANCMVTSLDCVH